MKRILRPTGGTGRGSPRTRERREREHAERRREIVTAAREVFARRGYRAATLDEIAEKAAFAKGTLYNYFTSKEDLFRDILNSLLEDMRQVAVSVVKRRGNSREKFQLFARGVMEYYRANEDLLRIVTMDMNRMELEKENRLRTILLKVRGIAGALAKTLEADMRARRVVTEDPVELAQVFVALIHNRSVRRSFEAGGLKAMNAELDADFLTRLFFDGIALE